MRIALAYLVPMDEWSAFRDRAKRFAESLRQFPPMVEHDFHVVCCNGDATDELRAFLEGIPYKLLQYQGGGRDCGAEQSIAHQVECDFLVCANAGVYFHRAGWLKQLVQAREAKGKGLYGVTASFESFPYVAGRKNPHLRTSFFGCDPKTLRDFPHSIDSREKCFRFECGDWNFTRWCEDRGEPGYLVTWDGCYRSEEFRSPANVFRKGDQSNLLIRDRHIDLYERAEAAERIELETLANGGVPPARATAETQQAGCLQINAPEFVSIGMPVYNGGMYLRPALESLLAQDYPHFELIISDNCSTDDTEAICWEFAARDGRVRYVRQEENKGSPWNFAFVAREARHDYFMWAAHDDTRDASYIRKCLSKLSANPTAVLCCSEVNFIDAESGPSVHYAGYSNIETLGMSPVERIHELISRPGWFALYGVMRTAAARRISLGLDTYGCDVVLLLELLLQGDFVKVPERLFDFRISIVGKSAEDYQKDFNLKSPASAAPYAGLAVQLMETVYRSQLSAREKTEVFADFLLTLSTENLPWRTALARELVVPDAELSARECANLLGLIFVRAMPLAEMRDNPFSKAIFRAGVAGLGLAALASEFAGERAKAAYAASIVPAATTAAAAEAAARVAVSGTDGFFQRQAARMVELGKLEEASKLFRAALDQHETSDGWADWATVQLARGLIADAESGFRRAVAVDAQNASATVKLGILLVSQGRTREAVPLLEQGVGAMPASQRGPIKALLNECRSQLAPAFAR